MTLNKCGRPAIRVLVCLGIVLATVSVASASWKEKVLYSFQGGLNDGSVPAGGVVFDRAGNLYGATTGGGPDSCAPIGNECGTVFQLAPPAKKGDPWTETILYQFKGEGSQDGSAPAGGVILDAAGNIYGTTAYGGTGDCILLGVKAGCGTVYELSPPKQKGGPWTERLRYSFKGGNDGYFPSGTLTFDSKGNLYGATQFGGGKGTTCNSIFQYCGTVFELRPARQKGGQWTEKVLHSFAGGKDGANPNGGLVFDRTGALYGTTLSGGNEKCKTSHSLGCGTFFVLKPSHKKSDWTEALLHLFSGGADGATPNGDLAFDLQGRIDGTSVEGGDQGSGVVFEFSSRKSGSWSENVLHSFTGKEGWSAEAGVLIDSAGKLYGTVSMGGAGGGTVYLLEHSRHVPNWRIELLHTFIGNPDGISPAARLAQDSHGQLYGTTLYGGTGQGGQNCGSYGCGTVFLVFP